MKKLFGGIDLTWKKLIIFSIIVAAYTASMAIIPITKDTSFRDISIQFEWWILFGIIIICNSKSPKDSALKCFVFFLISQPLIYLIQVPFSYMGWNLFSFYRYWFIWTILCLPMGYIGYYIKKDNILSVLILLPMLIFLSYLGLGYFNSVINSFPNHLLSCIFCFVSIIVIVINVLEKTSLRVISFIVVILFIAITIFMKGGFLSSPYETYKNLDEYNLNLSGEVTVTSFSSTGKGNVEVAYSSADGCTLRLIGDKNNKDKNTFTITDSNNNSYNFEYYYDKDQKTVILNKVN